MGTGNDRRRRGRGGGQAVPSAGGTPTTKSVDFDGVDDQIKAINDSNLDLPSGGNGNFTIILWAKLLTVFGKLLFEWSSAGSTTNRIVMYDPVPDGNIKTFIRPGSTTVSNTEVVGDMSDGGWHLLSYQREGNTWRKSFDGENYVDLVTNAATFDAQMDYLEFGHGQVTAFRFRGRIAHFSVTSDIVTDEEIAALNSDPTSRPDNMTHAWDFGDTEGDSTGAGGTIQDVGSGTAVDLAATNMDAEDIVTDGPV